MERTFINRAYGKALRIVSPLLSDKLYLKLLFRYKKGYWMDFANPQTFSEKLQWLKLYNRNPLYTVMVDKVKAKEYVASKIGTQYIIPTLGVWERVEDIDFDSLPNRFVIKCNHNSGKGMYICKDKSEMDVDKVKKDLKQGLKENYYLHGREWPYKDVPRRIIAEQYMEDESGYELKDYKVFNFNGKPELIEVDFDRFIDHHRNIYSTEWKRLELEIEYRSDPKRDIPRPEHLDEMLKLCSMLAADIPHVRTDFYVVNGRLYFGELTFFHGSGMERFNPEKWDARLGSLIKIPVSGGVIYIVDNQHFMLCLIFHSDISSNIGNLRDYKFYCFGGQPKLCQVISDRATDEKIDFYDMDWNRIKSLVGLTEGVHNSMYDMPRPRSFNDMLRYASILSEDLPFSRIDFYDINGSAYFGEITFFPTSGFGRFHPREWDKRIGDWICLPAKN